MPEAAVRIRQLRYRTFCPGVAQSGEDCRGNQRGRPSADRCRRRTRRVHSIARLRPDLRRPVEKFERIREDNLTTSCTNSYLSRFMAHVPSILFDLWPSIEGTMHFYHEPIYEQRVMIICITILRVLHCPHTCDSVFCKNPTSVKHINMI